MRILLVNKFHYLRGGSEAVYFGIAKNLESHGHQSIYFSMAHPENISCETSKYFMPYVDLNSNGNGKLARLKTAARILYSFDAKKRLSNLLNKHAVDIAHLHNIHHQISPSILHELKKRKIPVVMTLHDYKMGCASYSMLAGGKPCEACAGGRYYEAVRKRCVKKSFAKSSLAVLEMYFHHRIMDIYNIVDVFISPSLFLKNMLAQLGFRGYIVHLPNFINSEVLSKVNAENREEENSIVYFGRLSEEKGVRTLLEAAAKSATTVKIIGDGPIRESLESKVKSQQINNIRFLGYMKGNELFQEIKKSRAVIIPSEWYENNPMSVIEAFALGKPVIGSRIGGIPELVRDGETGFTFEPWNAEDLSEKINMLLSDEKGCVRMGQNARKFVETELNSEKHYQKLMEIYQMAINKNGRESI